MNMPWCVNFLGLIRRGKRSYFWDSHPPCVPAWTIKIRSLCLLVILRVRCGKLKWDVSLLRTPVFCYSALGIAPRPLPAVRAWAACFLNCSFLMRRNWPLNTVAVLNYFFCVLNTCQEKCSLKWSCFSNTYSTWRNILFLFYLVHNYY